MSWHLLHEYHEAGRRRRLSLVATVMQISDGLERTWSIILWPLKSRGCKKHCIHFLRFVIPVAASSYPWTTWQSTARASRGIWDERLYKSYDLWTTRRQQILCVEQTTRSSCRSMNKVLRIKALMYHTAGRLISLYTSSLNLCSQGCYELITSGQAVEASHTTWSLKMQIMQCSRLESAMIQFFGHYSTVCNILHWFAREQSETH